MKKVISILIAMLLVMATVAPAMASCPYESGSPATDTEQEIIDAISKDKRLPIPDNYFLYENPDGSGYVLGYQSSSDAITVIDISPNYKIREIWNAVVTEIPGGYNVVLTSNKGKEEVVLITSDPSSDTVKITRYDSSGNVVTIMADCYSMCTTVCSGLTGTGCGVGCLKLCAALIETGIGYAACVAVCLGVCYGLGYLGCDAICNAIC